MKTGKYILVFCIVALAASTGFAETAGTGAQMPESRPDNERIRQKADTQQNPEKVDSSTQQSIPKIFVPESDYTFTDAVEGNTIVHKYKIQNKGDAELKITHVKTG